jgi:two-component system CheB/CheR fusion protein
MAKKKPAKGKKISDSGKNVIKSSKRKSTAPVKIASKRKPAAGGKHSRKTTDELVDASSREAVRDLETDKSQKNIVDKPAFHPSGAAPDEKLFPIVAIGASAGGLEPTSTLLHHLNDNTGMTYVIIHHLSPDHKSLLPEIFSKDTSMKVQFAENNMKPEPDNVYVIKPNTTLTISGGLFRTSPRTRGKKIHMSIDYFMRSLAEDSSHFPIGVILSGADSDGMIGLENIKNIGGITFAQERSSARYMDMPRNAILSGAIDFELSTAQIAEELNKLARNPYMKTFRPRGMDDILPAGSEDIQKIFRLLKSHTHVDFTNYKPSTVKRRILRRMVVHKVDDIKEYIKLLSESRKEVQDLYEDILINVTSFFRDNGMYESIRNIVLPGLFEGRAPDSPIRIWVTACSTGEEAYSIAIIILEYLEDKLPSMPIQIFSTDLSDIGIEKARKGIYPEDIKGDVSPERLKKYFTKVDGKYQINKTIRDMCIFAKQNLVQDPPFSHIDMISCRNVLIYLGQVLQKKVIPVFHYALKPSGFLVLGTSETVGTFTNLFEIVDRKFKIYKKRPIAYKIPLDFANPDLEHRLADIKGAESIAKDIFPERDITREADNIVLNKYAPASVVIKSNYEILQFRGKTDAYLSIPTGTPSYNLLKMAKEGLAVDIQASVTKAARSGQTIRREGVQIKANGAVMHLNIIVIPIKEGFEENLFLIIFEEAPGLHDFKPDDIAPRTKEKARAKDAVVERLNHELSMTKDYLQAIIEQQETTNEELRSANEEIQSSNEELQSTNEELETAKEELQSANEELTTVNEELQNRNNELSSVNNDLNNLLGSINITIVMLDINMRIRRFTSIAEKVLNLIPTDVGRKITDINPNVRIDNLEELINDVVDTPTIKEFEVQDKGGVWYSVRIRPYKTLENKIDGVLITLVDVDTLKRSLEQLEDSKEKIQLLNEMLEKRVSSRTFELKKTNNDLQNEIAERKHMENSLRILSRHLVEAQEVERLKLSRELHDGINQILSSAKLKMYNLEELAGSSQRPPELLKPLREAKDLIEKTISEVRRISKNLRPITLEDLGIEASLQSLCEEFSARTRIEVTCDFDRFEKRLTPDIELALYRILQEALHNIEKHSSATKVFVDLRKFKDTLEFRIRDNGKGFNLEKYRQTNKKLKRLGLIGMKERAEFINGKLEVRSSPGKGTEISIGIPIIFKEQVLAGDGKGSGKGSKEAAGKTGKAAGAPRRNGAAKRQ